MGGGGGKGVRDANSNERSRGRSVLHGQDMGKTDSKATGTLMNNGWRLAVGGVGGSRFAVGRPWGLALRAVLNQKKWGS